jgi:hypothetical protein
MNFPFWQYNGLKFYIPHFKPRLNVKDKILRITTAPKHTPKKPMDIITSIPNS